MKNKKTFIAISLAMIFCCILSTGCTNKDDNGTTNTPSEFSNVSNKGVSIKFSDEFYIECSSKDILISDSNEIYVNENTKITPKLKKEFTSKLTDSNSDKIDFLESTVYHNICVNDEVVSFEDFKNYKIVAEDDIVISLAKSEIKPIGICLYQKTSKNSNWSETQKNPENINSYLNFEDDQLSTTDKFLLYSATLDNSNYVSNATSFVKSTNLNDNSIKLEIFMEVFLEATKVLPTIICSDSKNNIHLIHFDIVEINLENNKQEIISFDTLNTGEFNHVSSLSITVTNNLSSIKK